MSFSIERIKRLREQMLKAEHARHRVFIPREWSVEDMACSLPERKAHALKLLLDKMPVFIEDDELIVGGRTVFGRKDFLQESIVDPSLDVIMHNCFPRYSNDTDGGSQGHYVPHFPRVMKLGFGGIAAEARERLEHETCQTKRNFLSAVAIVYDAAGGLALRYAELADSMAKTADAARRAELAAIAQTCHHIATKPPETLHQAAQLMWFTHLIGMIENFCLMSFGRADQYLLPFYRACDKDEAAFLLRCLIIKMSDQSDLDLGDVHYDGQDNLVLGGLLPDGRDATNELTFAFLDALDDIRLSNPEIAARVHAGSPDAYVRRISELATTGMGQLAFFNDDAFVPALAGMGFPLADARDYVLDACQDILLDGKSEFYLAGIINLTGRVLETVAASSDDDTWEEFIADMHRRIDENVRTEIENYRKWENVDGHEVPSPLPFLSGTMVDCVRKRLDILQGGLTYNAKGIMISGAPVTATNGLAAIKHVIFDRREATMSELQHALADNYEGHGALRQKLLAAPKWGNDDDYADLIGKDIIERACREVLKYRMACGEPFIPGVHQPHSWGAGQNYGATPDGRRAKEPIPVTLSPANGTDKTGATAVMRSVAKIDPMLSSWNNALGMTFHPSAVRGEAGLTKFTQLLRTFFGMGGEQLQLNVVSADELRAAQREPEKYPDLIVRVWGFSGRFVELCKGYQEDVIARTEHII